MGNIPREAGCDTPKLRETTQPSLSNHEVLRGGATSLHRHLEAECGCELRSEEVLRIDVFDATRVRIVGKLVLLVGHAVVVIVVIQPTEVDGDCNDDDGSVRTGAHELPDCKDNNCDGTIDESLTRRRLPDRYEPNDDEPFELPGAVGRRPVLGFAMGYKKTYAKLNLVSDGGHDREKFSVWTHDGSGDTWHVEVEALSIGDHQRYAIEILGQAGQRRGVLNGPHSSIRLDGTSGEDNSGTYQIVITPQEGNLEYCPLVVEVRSG